MKKYSTKLLEEIYERKRINLEQKRIKLLEKCKKVCIKYFSQMEVNELYITGSLIVSGKFSERSDIDIAVSGLHAELYFKTISELEDKLERKVEIIELENCKFAEKIKTTGLKLI